MKALMALPHILTGKGKKNHWWHTKKRIVDNYIKVASEMIETGDQSEIVSASKLLDAALVINPRQEKALELKAKALLRLGRYKDVADMLQDYIPSLNIATDGSASPSSGNSSSEYYRGGVKLLLSSDSPIHNSSFKCFSLPELKKKVIARLPKNCQKGERWRYWVLGKACYSLGLLDDAMVLLQTGKRLASAAFRQQIVCWSDDVFSLTKMSVSGDMRNSRNALPTGPTRTPLEEYQEISQLLSQIKFLLLPRNAALAALNQDLYTEAIWQVSKIVDSRRNAPQGFLAECYMYRASAYRSAGRIAESIADCNRTLALDPSCIHALDTRASLLESIHCLPDCLHDLEHLKLLYRAILRNRKLPGPAWKRHNVRYREIPGKLCALINKINGLKQRVAAGETGNVDYVPLTGLQRGCSMSELERAHLSLCLRHKPDKAIDFIYRCEVADECELESIKERAKISSLFLYRLIQKGYTSIMARIREEEAAENQRRKAAAALQSAKQAQQTHELQKEAEMSSLETDILGPKNTICSSQDKFVGTFATCNAANTNVSVFTGTYCRDIAAVGRLLPQVGFNHTLRV